MRDLREKAGQGTGPRRSREGAGESGGVPGPLRGRAVHRGVPGGGSGTPTSTAPISTRSSRSTFETAGWSNACAYERGGERIFIDGAAARSRCRGPTCESASRVALVAHPHLSTAGPSTTRSCRPWREPLSNWATSRCGPISAASANQKASTTKAEERPKTCSASPSTRIRALACCRLVSRDSLSCSRPDAGGAAHEPLARGAGGRRGRRFPSAAVPGDSIVIHGERDETVPLCEGARLGTAAGIAGRGHPGADHFFHLRLNVIKNIVKGSWRTSGAQSAQGLRRRGSGRRRELRHPGRRMLRAARPQRRPARPHPSYARPHRPDGARWS